MLLILVIMYALFASTFSLGKVLLLYAKPIFVVGIRMSIAGGILFAYYLIMNRGKLTLKKNHSWLYLQIILFTTYFPYIFRFWGLRFMPSSKACLLYNLSPFVSYIFSYFLATEEITLKKIVGLIIGFLGFIPIIFFQSAGCNSDALLSFGMPELFILLAVACTSYGWILVHQLMKYHNYPSTMLNGMSMLCGGLLALGTSFLFEGHEPVQNTASFIGIVSIIILVSNLLCHNLYAELLKMYSPTFVSFASFLSPLFAALYGWFFLNETITWQFFFTVGCVLIGLALFYQDELKQPAQQVQL